MPDQIRTIGLDTQLNSNFTNEGERVLNIELISDHVGESLSRRGFVSGVGFVAAGAAAALAMPGFAHADDAPAVAADAPARIFDGQMLAQGHIVHDPDKCAGCRQCEIVCTLNKWDRVDPEISNIRVRTDVLGGFITEVEVCQQCAGAECMAVCPTGALHADEATGARVIDQKKCTGCQLCLQACPVRPSNIHYIAAKNTCMKCDLCGGDPMCVKHCPGEALSCSWIEAAADANVVTTDTGIVVTLDLTGAVIVVAPDSVTVSGINTVKSGNSVSVVGNVASTYTQPFEAKIKVSYFDAAGETLFFSERLVVDVPIDGNVDFEDIFETADPNAVAACNLEIMCGKIAG